MKKSYKFIKEEFDRSMSNLEEKNPYPQAGSVGPGSEVQQSKFADEREAKSLDGMQDLVARGRYMIKVLQTPGRDEEGSSNGAAYFADPHGYFKYTHDQISLMRQGLGKYYKATRFKKQEVSRELGALIEKSRSLIAKATKMFPTIFKKYSSEYNRKAEDGLPEIRLPDGEFYAIVPLPVGPKEFQGYKGEKEMMNKRRFASQLRAHGAKLEAFDLALEDIQNILETISAQRKKDENPQQQAEPKPQVSAATSKEANDLLADW